MSALCVGPSALRAQVHRATCASRAATTCARVFQGRGAALHRSAGAAAAPASARRSATTVVAAAAAVDAGNATESLADAYQRLSGTQVYRVSDQQPVDITSLWGGEERAVVAFARHMGLERDVAPALAAKKVKLYLVSIGAREKGLEFAAGTGFPAENLLADEKNACYSALNFAKGIRATFFNPATSAAIKERMSGGKDADLKSVMKAYKPLMPKEGDQAFWQGGVLVFEGPKLLWGHADPGMAAHADLDTVVAAATAGL